MFILLNIFFFLKFFFAFFVTAGKVTSFIRNEVAIQFP